MDAADPARLVSGRPDPEVTTAPTATPEPAPERGPNAHTDEKSANETTEDGFEPV